MQTSGIPCARAFIVVPRPHWVTIALTWGSTAAWGTNVSMTAFGGTVNCAASRDGPSVTSAGIVKRRADVAHVRRQVAHWEVERGAGQDEDASRAVILVERRAKRGQTDQPTGEIQEGQPVAPIDAPDSRVIQRV